MSVSAARYRTLAAATMIAASGYGLGWWHHGARSPVTNPDEEGSRRKEAEFTETTRQNAGQPVPGSSAKREGAAPEGAKPNLEESLRALLARGKESGAGDLARALGEWAREDPRAAFAAFMAEPRLQNAEGARALFRALGEKDPVAALAMLDQLPLKPWSRDAAGAMAEGWVAKDPNAAAAAGLGLPPGMRRRQFLSSLVQAWQQKDTIALAAWLKALPPGENAQAVIGKEANLFMGSPKSAEHMSARLEIYQLAPESQKTWLLHEFMHWAGSKPDDAVRWAFQLPAGSLQRSQIIDSAAGNIKDHETALQMLSSATDAGDRIALSGAVARTWSARDPEAAWRWASTLPDDAAKEAALQSVRGALITADPDKAVAFLQQQQPDKLKEWGPQAAAEWAKVSPDAALTWAAAVPADQRDAVLTKVIEGLAGEDPSKAFGESGRITDASARANLYRTTAGALAREDVTLASTRIDAMPPGHDRDAAILGFFSPAFEIEPDSALIWAAAIQDPSQRDSTVNDGFSRWLSSDAAAAEDWLSRANIDGSLREQLSSTLAARRKPSGGDAAGPQ